MRFKHSELLQFLTRDFLLVTQAARNPDPTEPQTSKLEYISVEQRPGDIGGSGVSCTSTSLTLATVEGGASGGRLEVLALFVQRV